MAFQTFRSSETLTQAVLVQGSMTNPSSSSGERVNSLGPHMTATLARTRGEGRHVALLSQLGPECQWIGSKKVDRACPTERVHAAKQVLKLYSCARIHCAQQPLSSHDLKANPSLQNPLLHAAWLLCTRRCSNRGCRQRISWRCRR